MSKKSKMGIVKNANTRYNNLANEDRGVAQLVAYVLWEHGVAGSNPVTSTRWGYLR